MFGFFERDIDVFEIGAGAQEFDAWFVESLPADRDEAGADDAENKVVVVPGVGDGANGDDVVAEGVADEGVGARVAAPLAAFEYGAGAGGQSIALAGEAVGALDDFVAGAFEPALSMSDLACALGREIAEDGRFAADESGVGGVGHVGLGRVGFDELDGVPGSFVGSYYGVVFDLE